MIRAAIKVEGKRENAITDFMGSPPCQLSKQLRAAASSKPGLCATYPEL
jgi:hypothetical protein